LPYIDIGEANRGMARAIKTNKKKRGKGRTPPPTKEKRISLNVPPGF
jgi:hypothetical protein